MTENLSHDEAWANQPDPVDYIEKCQSRLISFARAVYPSFQDPWHLRELAKILERVEAGELDRVMIQFPPRHGKSVLSSQIFPAWFAGRNPNKKIMVATGTHTLADEFGRYCRNFLRDPNYNLIFPDANISADSQSRTNFHFGQHGVALFASRGTQITGKGADLFIMDDLTIDAQDADSEAGKKEVRTWYKEVAYNRLQKGGRIIMIGTRWRADDIQGWLLDPEEQERIDSWHIFRFPAIAEEDEEYRKTGEALWPDAYDVPALRRIEGESARAFAGTYQQRPSIEAGNIVQRDWLTEEKVDESQLMAPRIMAIDTAFKEGAENDYSSACVAQRTRNGIAILYAEHKKLNYPNLIKWVQSLVKLYGIQGLLIEDKASGQSLIQTLRQHSRIPVIPVTIKRNEDKESRLHAICPFLESKRVVLHKWSPASTRQELINELLQFPNGAHDDYVDSFVHAITYLIRPGLSLRRLGGQSTGSLPVIYDR